MDVKEQKFEMMKEQLQKIPRIERSLEQLTQNLVQSIQSMRETQKMVVALAGQEKMVAALAGQVCESLGKGEGVDVVDRGTEESSKSKRKTPE